MSSALRAGPRALPDDLARLRDRARRFEDDADPFLRGLVATEVYRTHPDWPAVRLRAEVLARTLSELSPVILPEETCLGIAYRRHQVHGGVSDPDAWRRGAMYPEYRQVPADAPLPDEVREALRWWDGRRPDRGTPERAAARYLAKYGLAAPHAFVGGHTLPDHGIVLREGIGHLRMELAGRLLAGGSDAQIEQWRAMDRCLDGLSQHARATAAAARATASSLADPRLRRRLEAAAARCERLAIGAPATLAEALQLLFFANTADLLDSPGDAASFGRIDQLLWPFYLAERATGALCEEEAFRLICGFVIKRWTAQNSINLTVGGVLPDGSDGTNDLSAMFLEAMESTELTTDLTVRLHTETPPEFLSTVTRIVRRGFGRPSLYGDEATITALVRVGVAIEDASDYAPLGCVEVMIPGRSSFRTMGFGLNLRKVLELVVNRGRCLVTDDLVWDDVPAAFDRYEDLQAEYRRRVAQVVAEGIPVIQADERREPEVFPRPWLTILSRGGIESGVDLTAGQPAYNPVGVTVDGIADLADSLVAIRRLVYEERRLTLPELREVLAADWAGHEPLRQYALNRLPRYGQDESLSNQVAADEAAWFAACFEPYRTHYGDRFWPMIFGVSSAFLTQQEPHTGATAAGRRQAQALAMSLQPNPIGPQGTTTAVLRSAAAIDATAVPGGISNVQECDPSLFEGRDGLTRLAALIGGFFDLGGMELSLNFLTESQLRAAQADPDRHRFLMVRVFGFVGAVRQPLAGLAGAG